jgi:Prefoldin subunit
MMATSKLPESPTRPPAGKLIHTNEVLVRLGADTFVETSTKEAQQVLHRRAAYVQAQIDKLRKQLDALQGRKDMDEEDVTELGVCHSYVTRCDITLCGCQTPHKDAVCLRARRGNAAGKCACCLCLTTSTCGVQEPVRDIYELYDEAEHGPLDGPSVRPGVVRQRYGPPRNAEEVAEEAELMQRLRAFVSNAQLDDAAPASSSLGAGEEPEPLAPAASAQQGSTCSERATTANDTVPLGGLSPEVIGREAGTRCARDEVDPEREEAVFEAAADEGALARELDRLAGAFDQTGDEEPPEKRCVHLGLAA